MMPLNLLMGVGLACRRSGGWCTGGSRVAVRAGLLGLIAANGVVACAEQTETVFDAPPAGYTELIGRSDEVIRRTLSVEERAGVRREGELVRVPVFFAPNECYSLDELVIVPAGGTRTSPPVIQADDVRRAPDGGISRAHLWFPVDLAPGATQAFQLVRRSGAVPAAGEPVPVEAGPEGLRVRTASGEVEFTPDGGLRAISSGAARWRFEEAGAFPRVRVVGPAPKGKPGELRSLDRSASRRTVTWSSGPLFAKVHVRIEAVEGVALELDYRIPRHGREVVVSVAVFPGEGTGALKENRLLVGKLAGEAAAVREIPAGIRYALRAEHGYTVTALTRPSGESLLAVPLVIGGSNGRWTVQGGEVTLEGLRGLKRETKDQQRTLAAYWTEVRLVPTTASNDEELWQAYVAHVQPLVAVVDEPGVTVVALHDALREVVREMKPVGWRQEAGRALVLDGVDSATRILKHRPVAREADEAKLATAARNTAAKLSNNGERTLRDDEKGRAYGPLDPYHITYTQSVAAVLAALTDVPEVSQVNLAMARAVREVGGRVDTQGDPYIDCFGRTLNMQMGPTLFGLTAGARANDTALVSFYRDLATAPPVLGVFGRGQRPYTGAPTKTGDQTDYLYQSISDFWLRTAELLTGENLGLHPLAFGRYTDCIDVMADRYHGVAARPKEQEPPVRANFYRGQTHIHRWLGWSCAPYIRLLETPTQSSQPGLTEAVHYTRAQRDRWKNWPDLTFYVLADQLVREPRLHVAPVKVPGAVEGITARREGSTATVTWNRTEGAAAYRLYRAERPGGPYRWLNSPHVENPVPPVRDTQFVDPSAPAGASYVVVAEDAAGRPGAWPERSTAP